MDPGSVGRSEDGLAETWVSPGVVSDGSRLPTVGFNVLEIGAVIAPCTDAMEGLETAIGGKPETDDGSDVSSCAGEELGGCVSKELTVGMIGKSDFDSIGKPGSSCREVEIRIGAIEVAYVALEAFVEAIMEVLPEIVIVVVKGNVPQASLLDDFLCSGARVGSDTVSGKEEAIVASWV